MEAKWETYRDRTSETPRMAATAHKRVCNKDISNSVVLHPIPHLRATPLSVVSQTPDICFFPSASKTECEYRKEQQQTRPSNAASRKNQKLTTVNSVLLAENKRLREDTAMTSALSESRIDLENEIQMRRRLENQLAEFHEQLLSGELMDSVC